MDYDKFVYKLGSLHSFLRELADDDQFQGEQTIVYTDRDGTQQTLHVYIDGTDMQMTSTPGNITGLNLFTSALPDED